MHKGTETPFIGEYDNFFEEGTFTCKRCNEPLFHLKANLMLAEQIILKYDI